ncbi:hypothetical protein [Streptomyces sp. NPDC002044]
MRSSLEAGRPTDMAELPPGDVLVVSYGSPAASAWSPTLAALTAALP